MFNESGRKCNQFCIIHLILKDSLDWRSFGRNKIMTYGVVIVIKLCFSCWCVVCVCVWVSDWNIVNINRHDMNLLESFNNHLLQSNFTQQNGLHLKYFVHFIFRKLFQSLPNNVLSILQETVYPSMYDEWWWQCRLA